MSRRVLLGALVLLVAGRQASAPQGFDLPPLPRPSRYGNLLIDRLSEANGQRPVGFSHWSHRTRYTCRVCHLELAFEMRVNATGISEEKNRDGEYCGACHGGKTAFGHTQDHCTTCHSGDIDVAKHRFRELRDLPDAPYGNRIDWDLALESGLIQPRPSVLDDEHEPMTFDEPLVLEAEWALIPPALFPHAEHQRWLDCAICHPALFNIKKKTTEHFRMRFILEGRFCGVCHLKVAFPLDDCTRCHPAMGS